MSPLDEAGSQEQGLLLDEDGSGARSLHWPIACIRRSNGSARNVDGYYCACTNARTVGRRGLVDGADAGQYAGNAS